MLDVHVLIMEYTDPKYIEQCKQSVDRAAELAGFHVHVHYLYGVFGHLGSQRKRGYSCGTAPYVTYVDDDDWVDMHAFSALREAMTDNVTAIDYELENGQ